jgi:ligand-binding sensor domain-containing protein
MTDPRLLALGLALLCASPDVSARVRLQRRFGVDEGLPFSEIVALAQDARGFLWIATTGGALFRSDGAQMQRWPRGVPRPLFTDWMAAGPKGEVVLTDQERRLLEVAGEDVQPVSGPGGKTPILQWPPVFDIRDNLWIVAQGQLWIRPTGRPWKEIPPALLGSDPATGVFAVRDGTVLVATRHALWRLDGDLRAEPVAEVEGVGKALLRSDGSVAALLRDGRVLELGRGPTREIYRDGSRPIDMVERGRTLWLSYDSHHVALREGEPPEILGPAEDVPGGGPLLVDREGSLWMGTFLGLRQFPSPDTTAWRGEGPPGARRLALTSEGVWVDAWAGLALLRREGTAPEPAPISSRGTGPLCVASDGTLWTAYSGRLIERRDGRFIEHAQPDLDTVTDCAAGAEGRVWFSSATSLLAAPAGRVLPSPAGPGGPVRAVLEDSAGRLWCSVSDRVCHTDARSAAVRPAWDCARLDGAGGVYDLAEVQGSIWAATAADDVHRWDPRGNRFEVIRGARLLPTRIVRRIRPSSSGGAWIVSFGTVVRAVDRPGDPDGFKIVERLSAWHGLMITDAEDVLEEPDGSLWIATLAGPVRVPAQVRREAPAPPPVELVDVLQDGRPLPSRKGLRLPWQKNRIELRFAALSYRDPSLLRFEVRLHPGAPWTAAAGPPSFRWVDLAPGSYRPQVRASLDGKRWSESSPGISFTVLPPFWRTPWFAALCALVASAGLYLWHRGRVARAVALERVRTRIAADLHDDIGASLSRIAVQSDLLRLKSAPDPERLAAGIGQSARALLDSMSDIVWSIDPRHDDLESLVTRVRHLALDLLEPHGIALELGTPEAAHRVKLGAEQRRHLYLILKEAVHNVVKHADCKNVYIALRQEGAEIRAEISDDGRGFEPGSPPAGRGGQGLMNMRSRAEQMGGSLDLRSAPGRGALLSLRVPVGRGES